MAVLVGKTAPDFTATAVLGSNEITDITLVQTNGPACSPVVTTQFPLTVGNIPPQAAEASVSVLTGAVVAPSSSRLVPLVAVLVMPPNTPPLLY